MTTITAQITWQLMLIIVLTAPISNDRAGVAGTCTKDVKVLFIGFRHGARSVIRFFPNDDNNSRWTVARGQTTPQGMRQHYKNGQMVRDSYAPMFDRYDPTMLLARSSAVDRTLMSASTFLASLVQPEGNQIFLDGFNWQPAAIYTTPVLEANVGTTIAIIEKVSGVSLQKDPLTFFILLDNLVTESFAGFKLPYHMSNNMMPKIQFLKDQMFMAIFGDPEVRCILAPPILHDFIQKTEETLRNETTQFIYIWSMHDGNVFAVLSALNDYRSESPPFAATLFFEVRTFMNWQNHEIKLLYRKDVDSAVVELDINGCSKPCTLVHMKRIVEMIENDCNFVPSAS